MSSSTLDPGAKTPLGPAAEGDDAAKRSREIVARLRDMARAKPVAPTNTDEEGWAWPTK